MYEEFLERCLSKISDDIDKREGSVIYTLLAPLCYELANIYFEISNFLDLSFIGTAYDEYLDKIGEVYNVSRNACVSNIKSANIISKNNVIGETFYSGIYNFTVIEALGDNIYLIEASEFSLDYNNIIGDLNCALNDVDEAFIIENITLATDAEDDEAYRLRILNKIQVKPYGGNISDYEEKILEQTGVSFVKIFTGYDDIPGNVNIVIASSDKNPVLDVLIDEISLLFNGDDDTVGIAPIGHNVIIHTTSFVNLDFEIDIQTNEDFTTVQNTVVSNISEFINDVSFNTELISLNKVLAQVFLDDNVIDATNLKINGLEENFILNKNFDNFEIARINSIIVNLTE